MNAIVGNVTRMRPLGAADRPLLTELATDASVLAWWPALPDEIDTVIAGDDDTVTFVVEVDGEDVGILQYWEEDEPEYRHAGIDIVLGANAQDRGIGADAVCATARYLFDELGHHRVTIDPDAANTRAIRCYEKVGFKRVGVMRDYEHRRDGTHRDGLLMDLLRSDLGG